MSDLRNLAEYTANFIHESTRGLKHLRIIRVDPSIHIQYRRVAMIIKTYQVVVLKFWKRGLYGC